MTIELGTKRRDRHDIVTEILKTAREGKIKTYLQLLVEKGFLENNTVARKRQTITLYKTTPKGVHFIENIEAVNQMLG